MSMVKEETSKHPHSKCRSKDFFFFFLLLFFVCVCIPHQNGPRALSRICPFCGDAAVYIPSISISLSARVFCPCLFLFITRMDEYTRKYTRSCLLILSIRYFRAGREKSMEEIRVTNVRSAIPAGRRVSRHQGVSRPSSPLASRVRLFVFGVGFGFRDCLPRIIFPPIPSANRRDKSVGIILWLFLRCVFGWEGSGGRPCFCRFWILGMAQILVGIGSVSSQYGESSRRRCGNVAYGTCVGSLAHWQRGYPGTCNLYNVAYQTWSVWFINSRFLSMDFETFLNSLSSFLFVFVGEVDQWMKILHSLCFFFSFVFCFFPLLFKLSIGYYVC